MRVSLKRFILVVYIVGCCMLSLINYRYSMINFEQKTGQKFYGIEGFPSVSDSETDHKIKIPITDSLGIRLIKNVSVTLRKFLNFEDNKIGGIPPKFNTKPLYPEDSMETDRILEQMTFVPEKLKEKPVLIYLPHSATSWGSKNGRTEFEKWNCPVQNCELSSKKTDAVKADAILFRQHINPTVISPKERRPEQIWIFYMLESPENSASYAYAKNFINWTATYRWDSDIVTPYERFTPNDKVPKDQSDLIKNSKFADDSGGQVDHKTGKLKLKNFAQGKTKQVAWFVSHCLTANKREQYVKELAKHISVDIFGTCGPLKCSRVDDKCWKMLDNDYKFYIAFENSNCQDYISEKYFINGLSHTSIPIVMGARSSEYRRVSPNHSFIHVDDFKSPKQLADYLNYLDKNQTAYNEYFRWRGTGQYINTKFWCRLCAMLNDPRPKVYPSLQDWWSKDKCSKKSWTA